MDAESAMDEAVEAINTPEKSLGFWKRNKKNILVAGISTVVAAVLTYVVTDYVFLTEDEVTPSTENA